MLAFSIFESYARILEFQTKKRTSITLNLNEKAKLSITVFKNSTEIRHRIMLQQCGTRTLLIIF